MGRKLRHITGARLRGSRRLAVPAAVVCALAFAGFGLAMTMGTASPILTATGPTPQTVTGNWGDTLAFVNGDSVPHSITSSRPELVSPVLQPGETYTSVLTVNARNYNYRQVNTDGRGSERGSVAVQAIGSVSLKTSKLSIAYGQSITLSGQATLAPVSIEEHQVNVQGWKQIKTLTPDGVGAYSTTLTPTLSTRYRAKIAGGQIISKQIGVLVTPTLKIASTAKKTKANHKVTVTSKLNPGSAASEVTLFGCNSLNPAWVNMASKKPNANGGVQFNVAMPRGTNYLRTTIVGDDITTGFVRPTSNTISIVGVAPKVKPVKKGKNSKPKPPSLRPPRHC